MDSRILIRLVLPIVCVLLVHTAVLLHMPTLGVFALAAVCTVNLIAIYWRGGSGRSILVWSVLSMLAGTAFVVTLSGGRDLTRVILMPPVLLNGFFLYVFGRTVLPGREPLITRFRRVMGSELTPETRLYTRRLTICWALLFAVFLFASTLLALYADLAVWSWIVNLGCPAAAGVFFLSEHIYRARYLNHFGSASLSRTLRTILHPDAWIADV